MVVSWLFHGLFHGKIPVATKAQIWPALQLLLPLSEDPSCLPLFPQSPVANSFEAAD